VAVAEAWKRENAEAMEAWNDWTARRGLPLGRHRTF
jgi:post-segregation antitoxin (ccd killing protein)